MNNELGVMKDDLRGFQQASSRKPDNHLTTFTTLKISKANLLPSQFPIPLVFIPSLKKK